MGFIYIFRYSELCLYTVVFHDFFGLAMKTIREQYDLSCDLHTAQFIMSETKVTTKHCSYQ